MTTKPTRDGRALACAGSRSIKRLIADHCADAHGIWLTTQKYRKTTLADVAKLDPCSKVLVA